jgi:hypothetical protein
MVQNEAARFNFGAFVQVIDAVGVEQRGAALDAVDFVALFQQKLGKVSTVLAGDAGDEGFFGHLQFTVVERYWDLMVIKVQQADKDAAFHHKHTWPCRFSYTPELSMIATISPARECGDAPHQKRQYPVFTT